MRDFQDWDRNVSLSPETFNRVSRLSNPEENHFEETLSRLLDAIEENNNN